MRVAPTARQEAEGLAGQRPAAPARWAHTDVALLQRSAGNRATVRHLRRLPRVLLPPAAHARDGCLPCGPDTPDQQLP